MQEVTIREISEVLGISMPSVKQKLQRKDIKPIKYVGMTGIYAPSVVDAIREVPSRGRPKRDEAEESAPATVAEQGDVC
jgi:hypothetical protein